jgi:hypothetical protein
MPRSDAEVSTEVYARQAVASAAIAARHSAHLVVLFGVEALKRVAQLLDHFLQLFCESTRTMSETV